MLYKHTPRDIQLMDWVFFSKWTGTRSGEEYFMKEYKMSHDEYVFVEKEILTIGESLGLIKVEWFEDGSGDIVLFYGHMCDKFYTANGFKGHFERLRNSRNTKQPTKAGITIKEIGIGLLIGVTLVLITLWLTQKLHLY